MIQNVFPSLQITVELPEALDPQGGPRSRVNAVHARSVREAGKKTLIRHQVQRMPRKFQADAHARYGYKERSEATHRIKRQRGRHDISLVKTGRLETTITRRRPRAIRIVGHASSGRVRFNMIFKFPFPVGRSRGSGVSGFQMAKELESFDKIDSDGIAQDFAQFYLEELRTRLKPRQRRRLGI